MEQVAFADRILLNKVDLVSEEEKAAVVKRIKVRGAAAGEGPRRRCKRSPQMLVPCQLPVVRFVGRQSDSPPFSWCLHRVASPPPFTHTHTKPQGINSAAEIIETVQAQADLDRVLGIGAFSLDRILEEEPDFLDVRGMRAAEACVFLCGGGAGRQPQPSDKAVRQMAA